MGDDVYPFITSVRCACDAKRRIRKTFSQNKKDQMVVLMRGKVGLTEVSFAACFWLQDIVGFAVEEDVCVCSV
jgi:hypothetical protein